ncbi:MAG: hypothetical protein DRJ51_04825 [Thermoprotei archaeon]|nr:MAG: hypothetical protein DRJ51_04825 [Thermoprotei archaeon]
MMLRINLELLVPALILVLSALISQVFVPRMLRRLFTFKHTMVKVLVKHFKKRPSRRWLKMLSMGFKAIFIISLVLVLLAPEVVRKEKVVVDVKREIPVSLERLVSTPVVIIMDVSGSMKGDKLRLAKTAAVMFIKSLPSGFSIGFIAFSDTVVAAEPLTDNRSAVERRIAQVEAGGGTVYSAPLDLALSWLRVYSQLNVTSFVVFITDGLPADTPFYRNILAEYRKHNITIFSVFIGTNLKGEEETRYMARETGGRQYTAKTIEELPRRLLAISREIKRFTLVKIDIRVERELEVKIPLYEPFLMLALLSLLVIWLVNIKIYKVIF